MFVYNIYSIVILILFDIPRFSVNDLHQIQVAAPSPSSRKSIYRLSAFFVHVKHNNVILMEGTVGFLYQL